MNVGGDCVVDVACDVVAARLVVIRGIVVEEVEKLVVAVKNSLEV